MKNNKTLLILATISLLSAIFMSGNAFADPDCKWSMRVGDSESECESKWEDIKAIVDRNCPRCSRLNFTVLMRDTDGPTGWVIGEFVLDCQYNTIGNVSLRVPCGDDYIPPSTLPIDPSDLIEELEVEDETRKEEAAEKQVQENGGSQQNRRNNSQRNH